MRKTVTITRAHIYGTPRYELVASYRGRTIHYWTTGAYDRPEHVFMIAPHWFGQEHAELLTEWRKRLKALGFTHWRFDGEWPVSNKPKGGKL